MSTFTAKHYMAVAKTLARTRPTDETSFAFAQWRTVRAALANDFRADNRNFNDDKFDRATEK